MEQSTRFEVRWFDEGAAPGDQEPDRPLICVLPSDATSDTAAALMAAARRHADVVVVGTRELISECLSDLIDTGESRW